MSGQATPLPITDALQSATGPQSATAPGKIEPADIAHMNMHDYMQPTTPSSESAFMSLAEPNMHTDHVQVQTPELRAQAPSEPNQILNDLGSSLEQTTNTLNSLKIPDMAQKTPDIVKPGKEFDASVFEKINDQMMSEQRELFNSVFVADERLQSATMGETMVANSATQTEKSMKQLLNGQG